ncbi:hypothetical protein ACVWYN_002788 [Pedobacter sp. UYP24]
MKGLRFFAAICCFSISTSGLYAQQKVFAGADEKTPSKAQYFSWINNTNEGPTEKQTLINFNFFNWLKKDYGMQLDIYAFDAGAIDGKNFYGSIYSDRFKKQFPNGFDPLYKQAKDMDFRLGVWGGPDGFGNTPEEQQQRIDQMVKLCKDYNFALYKFDAVCGPLRPEKEDAFIKMMVDSRKYSPDLILLNHRLGLTKGLPYATTFLWGGTETYIDVFLANSTTAPHHRAGALARGEVPGLQRLTEDHGVCLSSCLDNWDDDLILQAFNRSLILSPEIYGNPWLLSDAEYPKLARIYNIHRKYNSILINGKILPSEKYGADAVSRGDGTIRLITMKNLGWTTQTRQIKLGEEIGLEKGKAVKLVQIHPQEEYLGSYASDAEVSVKIEPFKSTLFIATTVDYTDPLITGSRFNVVKNVPGQPVIIDLVGAPGTDAFISVAHPEKYKKAVLPNGVNLKRNIHFGGTKLKLSPYRKLNNFTPITIPEDAAALYEATVFAADNNALEVRSLQRSGDTHILEVKQARDAFFEQETFIKRGVWDKNLFDGDMKTGFWVSQKYQQKVNGGMLRLDLGKVTALDELLLKVPNEFALQPLLPQEGNYVEVSNDLKTWKQLTYIAGITSHITINDSVRYFRFGSSPQQLVEIEGIYKGISVDRALWRASNLFSPANKMGTKKAWKTTIKLSELAANSYLTIALNGKHGVEGAYVAAKINGEYIGAPDRSTSYPSNTWEHINVKQDQNYTYYIPLKDSYLNKEIEIFVLANDPENLNIDPQAWIWSKDPNKKIRLTLYQK